MVPWMAASVRNAFRVLGLRIERLDPDLPEIWSGDDDFSAVLAEIESRSLVTPDRCFGLRQMLRLVSGLEGDVAELGVYRGGTARLLARLAPHRNVHLFDTFEGLPDVRPEVDRHAAGDFADTSLERVQAFLADCPNVRFHPGLFPGTAAAVRDVPFSLVHVDVDIVSSVEAALAFFYPRLVPGGVMVFDDYDWKMTPGVRLALEAFLEGREERLLITARYQAAFWKRA